MFPPKKTAKKKAPPKKAKGKPPMSPAMAKIGNQMMEKC